MKTLPLILIDTSKIDIDSLFFSEYISFEERKNFDKYTHALTKKEKIASLYLKNKYIGKYYLNEKGKPLSESKYFNISHSDGMVVLVIDSFNVGVDIEKVRPFDNDLKDYISSTLEKEYIKDDQTFFEVWTNKEALVKALGIGLNSNIKDIPSLPLNSERCYQGHVFKNKTLLIDDYVVTISRESLEEFEVEIKR